MQGTSLLNCYRIASDNITHLSKRNKEVFVFGSNRRGQHRAGAAAYAVEHFSAKWGVGEGMTGYCYALPTMEGIVSFKRAVQKFIAYAKSRPDRRFLVTKVGCGIAGYTVEQVAPMFRKCISIDNVYLPAEFYEYYKNVSKL